MKKEVAELWAEKLESGEYKQVSHGLRLERGGEYSHCCLGVLADISGMGSWHGELNNYNFYHCDDKSDSCVLPDRVREWAGLSEVDQSEFVKMNDKKKLTFKEIAQKVREKYLS